MITVIDFERTVKENLPRWKSKAKGPLVVLYKYEDGDPCKLFLGYENDEDYEHGKLIHDADEVAHIIGLPKDKFYAWRIRNLVRAKKIVTVDLMMFDTEHERTEWGKRKGRDFELSEYDSQYKSIQEVCKWARRKVIIR